MKEPKIVYILKFSSYKTPSAALNRINLFIKGLQELGTDVELYQCYSFFYRFSRTKKIASFLCKVKFLLKYLFCKNLIFIFYGENELWHLFPYIRNCSIVVERNEFPWHLISCSNIANDINNDNIISYLKYASGLITCSNELRKYYSTFLHGTAKVLVSPLIVDVDLFFDKTQTIQNKISYCGDWGNNKDGVDILIKAFALIHPKYPQMRLSLIGGSIEDVEMGLKALAHELGIFEYVDFVGRISHDKMPNYLCNSTLLALARPANKQAAGGIPSKVAEYLATGRPTVLTDVGELHLFLKDGENCYMAKPSSVEAFAKKMDEALSDPNASSIGQNGYQTALQFNIKHQSELLLNYLKTISHV